MASGRARRLGKSLLWALGVMLVVGVATGLLAWGAALSGWFAIAGAGLAVLFVFTVLAYSTEPWELWSKKDG